MKAVQKTFVIRELSEQGADNIGTEIQHLQREGHEIADVRRESASWRIYVYDRRFRGHAESVLAFRRRDSD